MNLQSLDALYHEVRECRNCNLWQSRILAVPGEGPEPAAVMFVGEAPGEREDRTGLPFQGNAGRVFNKVLVGAGLRWEEVYITGAVKCRPPKNRDPRSEEIEACNPYLRRQIELVQPGIIVALGRFGCQRSAVPRRAVPKKRRTKEGPNRKQKRAIW